MIYAIWTITFVALIISFLKDKNRTLKALKMSLNSFKNLIPGVLGMVAMVGLVLALVPKETLTEIFTHKGVFGFVLVALVGAIATIPAPIAFPLASSMLKVGASLATLASFITTLTMVGIVSAPLEASYFGKRFTIMRQVLSFVAAIAIGLIMGVVL